MRINLYIIVITQIKVFRPYLKSSTNLKFENHNLFTVWRAVLLSLFSFRKKYNII